MLPYFSDYKMHSPPPNLGGKWGGASYSPNVAYLARWGWGWGGDSGGGVFFLFSSFKT